MSHAPILKKEESTAETPASAKGSGLLGKLKKVKKDESGSPGAKSADDDDVTDEFTGEFDAVFRKKLREAKDELDLHDVRVEAIEREIKNLERTGGSTKRVRTKLTASRAELGELKADEGMKVHRKLLEDPSASWANELAEREGAEDLARLIEHQRKEAAAYVFC